MKERRSKGLTQGLTPIEVDTKKAAKLLMICRALDREVTGLDGKRVQLLTMVRYGISGPTFTEVKDMLDPVAA